METHLLRFTFWVNLFWTELFWGTFYNILYWGGTILPDLFQWDVKSDPFKLSPLREAWLVWSLGSWVQSEKSVAMYRKQRKGALGEGDMVKSARCNLSNNAFTIMANIFHLFSLSMPLSIMERSLQIVWVYLLYRYKPKSVNLKLCLRVAGCLKLGPYTKKSAAFGVERGNQLGHSKLQKS